MHILQLTNNKGCEKNTKKYCKNSRKIKNTNKNYKYNIIII